MLSIETLLEQCNADIRSGNPHLVARRLLRLNPSRLRQDWRLPLARICRRAGLHALGLRLLTRLIHNPRGRTATPQEVAEYAALLIRSGATDEALKMLDQVDAGAAPEKNLILAFAYFAMWEHQQAIPALATYLQTKLSPDAALVGQSNLAFALVECRKHSDAERQIQENIRLAQEQRHRHLENYNLAMLGQVHLQEKNFTLARETLKRTAENSESSHYFYGTKLKCILDGLESRSMKPFEDLRKIAAANRDWYALRDADLYSLKVDFNEARFLHLYFGSPLAGFRESIRHELGRIPDRHTYVLGQKTAPRFDLRTGLIDGRESINPGFKCHQLMDVLLRDFYQPLRVASLHASLFPGQHFNILSSPDRIHQIIRRTRRWLMVNRIPVHIEESAGFYTLVIHGKFSFRVPLEHGEIDAVSIQFDTLKKSFASKPMFSTKDVCAQLNISVSSAHNLLKKGIESGTVERLGPVKKPLGYRFKTSQVELRSAA